MSDSESDNEDNIPPREVCEERCQEFATVTGTDTALAMFYLQDRNWELEAALNAYFEANGGGGNAVASASSKMNSSTASNTAAAAAAASIPPPVTDPKPRRICLLSWNIDGLDSNNIKNRTTGVCKTILAEDPDVVFLQEVVPATLSMLESNCPQYQILPGGDRKYFTAMMLKVTSVTVESHTVTPFHTSKMMRNLLEVEATVKGIKCTLITSHAESTKDHAPERKRQLKTAFQRMTEASSEKTVIFGGDLNLRDQEVAAVGGIPEGAVDLWEVTGKRPEAKFTWDTSRNDNLEWSGKFHPKCRFDRLYMRSSAPAPALKTVYFELVGLERLKSCQRFPSDHWGILAHFDKTEKA